MLRTIIAASAIVLAMGTAAMAQAADNDWSPSRVPPAPDGSMHADRTTTGSIAAQRDTSGLNTLGNTGAAGPCAYNTAGPDANASGNVNDDYCGK